MADNKEELDFPRYVLYDDQESVIICAAETLSVIAEAISDRSTLSVLNEVLGELQKTKEKYEVLIAQVEASVPDPDTPENGFEAPQ